MTRLLDEEGVRFEFWDARSGEELAASPSELPRFAKGEFLEALQSDTPTPARMNVLGCAVSHVRLAQHVLETVKAEDGPVLVFEDDVVLAPHFTTRLRGLLRICPEDTEMLYVGHTEEPGHRPREGLGLRNAQLPRGCFGYVLWHSAAEKIVEKAFPLSLPIDEVVGRYLTVIQ